MLCKYVYVIVGCDRRRSGLSSAPLDMEYDNNSIEKYTLKLQLRHRHGLRLTFVLQMLVCNFF